MEIVIVIIVLVVIGTALNNLDRNLRRQFNKKQPPQDAGARENPKLGVE